jgi:glycosyltransferase involved in cell wall biosynthesis
MKVFFCNTLTGGSHYVRALLPLREGGWDGDKTSLRAARIDDQTQARAVLDADIVVFHRPNDDRSLKIAELLRSQGKKIVMDNDDTYKGFDKTKLGSLVDKFNKIDKCLDEFGRKADLITCSTEFLKREYLNLNPNVRVLPNCVDPEDWPDEDEILFNETDKVRIGFVGSVGMESDIKLFIPVLDELKKRKDIQLVLFALPADTPENKKVHEYYKPELEFWRSYEVEWHPFVPIEDYFSTLNELRLDIIVIPREDSYFNRCKSNLKFLEASMLKIPVIAQGFSDGMSPYQVNPEDSKHMRIVVDNSKWMEEIDNLIKDKNLRREMGEAARKYVIQNYYIKDKIYLWEEAYKSLK